MITLARRLNAFDATLVVMGGIVGSGIFMNPSVVAQRAHSPGLILGAWAFGGVIALIGAFIFAELAWRRPEVGGLYAYLRDAYHPVVAFMYGWTALIVSQSGGMAAAAITFAVYFAPLTHLPAAPWQVAIATLGLFTLINCFGVREGGNAQNALMLLKLLPIAALIAAGIFFAHAATTQHPTVIAPHLGIFTALAAAMIPVLYAYDGWQTAPFMSGELKEPARDMPRAMLWGVIAVIILYMGVNYACVRVLGPNGLMTTDTPASDIMRIVSGPIGATVIGVAVALSTLGFISNNMLVSPRIYYAMAADGLFFKQVAWLHPKTRVPVVAVVLQGGVAIVIALSGRYDQILNYVTSVDFVFFALAAGALFVFRRERTAPFNKPGIRVPWHPWSTLFFLLAAVVVVLNSYVSFPKDTLIGLMILLSAIPVYHLWRRVTISKALP